VSSQAINYWTAQLDEVAAVNSDRRSFHVFAEGMHSDVRGQIYNLVRLPSFRFRTSFAHTSCSS